MGDASVIGLTLSVTVGVWIARPVPLAGVLAVVLMGAVVRGVVVRTARTRSTTAAVAPVVAAAAVALVIGSWSGARAWQAACVGPSQVVAFDGIGTVMSDPAPVGGGRSVVVEIDGRRYEALVHGSPARRLAPVLAGQSVHVVGSLGPLPPDRARRLRIRHVIGRLDVERIDVVGEGSPATRAANRVRRTLVRGTSDLPVTERSLLLGLVIGDDRDQPRDLVDDFRESGLSHLTAVSGQNLSYVLLVAAPLTTRVRPLPRWIATLGLIGWFALLTRFEPSVIRAAGMAVLAATAFWRGRDAPPLRLLALTVAAFHVIDPLLVWSVGWWLSVAATAGIAVLAAPIERRLPGPQWFRAAAAGSLGASAGVTPISVLVFGRAPLVSLAANVLAVPVAGFVMVVGIPAGLIAALAPGLAPVVLLPARLGTRWVLVVARLAARVEPDGWGAWPAVAHGAAFVALLARRPRTAVMPAAAPSSRRRSATRR